MTEKETGGPAFPLDFDPRNCPNVPTGMSLRDWFAGQALASVTGMMRGNTPMHPNSVARAAYAIADAMIKARGE